jgi:hypothetical protein
MGGLRNDIEEDGDESADIMQSSGINPEIHRYWPRPSFQEDPYARFFNLFGSTTGTFNNPFLKTATFTATQTLSLTSVVNCVPSFQVALVPLSCRRRRSDDHDDFDSIASSETLKYKS